MGGLPNQVADPWRILGWVNYCGIESFGSVMVSLFWSFANSNINAHTAKASYGFVVATAQIGSILGPTFVSLYAETIGVPICYFLGAISMLCLIFQHRYIMGMFFISCFFMVQITVVDYTMKVLARDHFTTEHPCQPGDTCWDYTLNAPVRMSDDATAAFAKFLGIFGQATNTLSFFLSLLGTSATIRILGLNNTLLLFPALCIAAISMVWFIPTLWVVFASMMILKALTYSLNNPTKEILYQPTSPAVKYKAKSWIDIFGARGAKALGSVFTNAFSDSLPKLVNGGSF